MLNIDDRVYFHDPDHDISTGWGKVTKINGEIISLDKDDGGECECFAHELSRTPDGERLSEADLPEEEE